MRVDIVIDWNISDDLVKLVQESSTCTYANILKTHHLARTEEVVSFLNRIVRGKSYAGYRRMGIMKIMMGKKLVGYSLPREVSSIEYARFKLKLVEDFYRTGTIYVAKEHRGKGVAKSAARKFKRQYGKMIWCCCPSNEASRKTALSVGLKHSHNLYFTEQSDDPLFEMPLDGNVLSIREVYCS